ncbi:unnamed protein product [uncultured archaeal virus]|uniref:Uncharacterized protein n=1 Tax=uncultured archaeal virus TaxID=1960247 RepID=A0ABM9HVH5_9VIRU|nr:unnamed protein product [uncultured archaeal virus]CAI3524002.1 unnamed protein product [uncultured archaeal virus]CAI4043383.1 unnamed protein product [uncultured archaeal virus]
MENMNSDLEVIGMSPVIYEFMGKQRKLRNLTLNESIDLEVISVELNNYPVPVLERTRTVQDEEGEDKIETISPEEAMKTYKKDIKAYKKATMKIREKYLLMLFDEGEITPEEIAKVTSREWAGLRQKLNRQRYYDMGMNDLEIDELEKQAVKAGFQNKELLKELM